MSASPEYVETPGDAPPDPQLPDRPAREQFVIDETGPEIRVIDRGPDIEPFLELTFDHGRIRLVITTPGLDRLDDVLQGEIAKRGYL